MPGVPASMEDFAFTELVPLNTLRPMHLEWLIRNSRVDVVPRGRELWQAGEPGRRTVYLLSGELEIEERGGFRTPLRAGDQAARHPIDESDPRQATVRATRDSRVLSFQGEQMDRLISWSQTAAGTIDGMIETASEEDRPWLSRLLNTPTFFRVPPAKLQETVSRLKTINVQAGEVLIHQGALGDCCYFIRNGEAEVIREGAEKEEALARLLPGDCFGTDALLAETVRNATVRMATDGTLLRMEKGDFMRLLRNPVIDQVGYQSASRLVDDGALWLDVRMLEEYERNHLRGAANMPLPLIRLKAALMARDRQYIVYCDTGRRSSAAAWLLADIGFQVKTLKDGLRALSPAQASRALCRDEEFVLHRDGTVSRHRVFCND